MQKEHLTLNRKQLKITWNETRDFIGNSIFMFLSIKVQANELQQFLMGSTSICCQTSVLLTTTWYVLTLLGNALDKEQG